MINFTRAFDSAWERMSIILFQPFDFGKWLAIALSAFLAGLLAGGNGDDFSPSFPNNFQPKNQNHTGIYQHHDGLYAYAGDHVRAGLSAAGFTPFSPAISPQQISAEMSSLLGAFSAGFLILLFVLFFVCIIALSLLFYWLGSRGQFMLLDNIVRNRGAVGIPWTFYEPQANRVFVFYLVTMVAGIALMVMLVAPISLIVVFSVHGQGWPSTGPIVALVTLGALYLVTLIAFFIALFLFREWTIPLMFRNGWDVKTALRETWKLIRENAGSTTVFILLRIALFIAMIVISNIMCLLTCCCGERLPYIGTVLLLPAVIYLRCFSLDVLAQFGPQYDVFTVDLPPGQADPIAPSLPPQLG